MKTLLKLIIFLPFGLVLIAFAIANRTPVTVGLDPLAKSLAAEGQLLNPVTLPLFVIVFATLMAGVLIGGFAAWIGQGRHRRAARHGRAEVERLRADAVSARPLHDA